MTEFTDYNDYELPEPFNINERNEWGRILNDALDQLDDDIILRATLTQRPDAETKGRLFLDTGSYLLYYDTGSNWIKLGSQLAIKDSGATIDINPEALDYDKGFTVTNPNAQDARIDIDVSEFITTGLEDDGSNNIRVDEGYGFDFTSNIDFSGGLTLGGTLDADGNLVNNVGSLEMDGNIFGGGIDISITEVDFIQGPANGGTSLQIATQGDGSHDITLRDGFNSQDIAVFNEGGDVEIPNGDLTVSDNITSNAGNISQQNTQLSGDGSTSYLTNSANGFDFQLRTTDGGGSTILNMLLRSSGNVEIPNGSLDIGSGNVAFNSLGNGNIQSGTANLQIQTAGSGTNSVLLYDEFNSQDILVANEGGDVDIPNGRLTAFNNLSVDDTRLYMGSNDEYFINYDSVSEQFEFTRTEVANIITYEDVSGVLNLTPEGNINLDGNVSISNGDLDVSNNQIIGNEGQINFGSSPFLIEANSAGRPISFRDNNNTTLLTMNEGGVVEIPSGNLDMGTNQVTNLPAPTSADHAARKGYVDGVAQGLNLKDSVRASPTVNIDLASATDPNPVDGVTLSNGDRVLLKEQTDGTENGIYIATTATDPTTWTRSADADEDAEVTSGMFTFVEEGTANGSTSWIVTTDDPITVDTTSITFSQFASAGEITAGDGLGKSGQDLFVNFGTGVELNSDNVRLDEDYSPTWTAQHTFQEDVNIQDEIDFINNAVNIARGKVGSAGNLDLVGFDGINLYGGETGQFLLQADDADGSVTIPNGNLNLTNNGARIQVGGAGTQIIEDLGSSMRVQGQNALRLGVFSGTSVDGLVLDFNGNVTVGEGALRATTDTTHQIGASGNSENTSLEVLSGGNAVDIELTTDNSGSGQIAFDGKFTFSGGDISIGQNDIVGNSGTSALEIDERASLADSGKVQLSGDASPQGYAMIQDVTNSVSCMIYLGGSANSVEILHDSGVGDNFSTVEDQNGTTNIYWDAGNAQYEINNETGASATYSLQIMKA